MFRNYLKIAWRNLTKNKQQTIINLLGLTVGTVSCLTILLYVFAQFGYDQQHENAESIYRVRTVIERSGQDDFISAATGPPTGPAMKADFPEVTEASRIVRNDEFGIKPVRATGSEDGYYEPRCYLADSTVFKVFSYKFLEGTTKTALNAPNTVVLSAALAKKLFGNEKCLNQTMEWGAGEEAETLTVTGVFDETFGKSHLNPNYFVSMNTPGIGEFVRTMDIITQQFNYTQHKDLGFNKENLINVRMGSSAVTDNYEALKSQFLGVSGVSDVARFRYSPAERVLNDFNFYLPGKDPEKAINIQNNAISEDYFKTMKIHMLKGRELREGDEMQIVVNESVLKYLDIDPENALGTKLLNTRGDETMEFEIVGVAEDFHFADFKTAIEPLVLYKSSRLNWMVLRTENTNYEQLLGQLEQIWKSTVTNVPFTYAFMDREVGKMYEEEKRLGNISMVFTIIAILISCLGLFGLISYVAEQKKKEIGIRKVLGASIGSVVRLLTKDFLKLVLVAFVIATPVAYYFMNRWLEAYTYRIDVQWWVFLLAGGFALIITIFTVGFQSLKSALANPVKSLRTE